MIHPELQKAAHKYCIKRNPNESDESYKKRIEKAIHRDSGAKVITNLADVSSAFVPVTLPYWACSFAMKEDVRQRLRDEKFSVRYGHAREITNIIVNGIVVTVTPEDVRSILAKGDYPDFLDMLKET